MTAWKEVRTRHISFVHEMEKIIPGYSYDDKATAVSTNQKLTEYLINNIGHAKSRLFDVIQFLYEIQGDKISAYFEQHRHELDHFSDRINARHFEWREIPEKFLEKVLEEDRELVNGVKAIASTIEHVYKLSIGFQRVDHKIFDTKKLEAASKKLGDQIRKAIMAFEKRSALLDIKGVDLEAAYEKIVKEIESKF